MISKAFFKNLFYTITFFHLFFSSQLIAGNLDSLQAGYWLEIPESQLQLVIPSNVPPGVEGAAAVMTSWSGGVYDSRRDRLVVWGGGHNAYSGNEIYSFDIKAYNETGATQWERLTEPSTNVAGIESSGVYPDGLPRSRHTYNYIEYLPNIDKFVSFGGHGQYSSGQVGDSKVHTFDFDNNTWDSSREPVPSGGSRISSFAAYDSKTGNAWYHSTERGRLSRYDPLTDTWTQHASEVVSYYATPAIDPERHIMVAVGGYGGVRQILVWDLDNPDVAPYTPETSGDTTLEYKNSSGFEYDPVLKKFVGWRSGSDVYVLDPDTWNWTKIVAAPANTVQPTSGEARGTYGRFRYVPSLNVYIVVNRINENIFVYKLSDAAGIGGPVDEPVPSLTFYSNKLTVNDEETITLTWNVTHATLCTASGDWTGSVEVSGSQILGPLNSDSEFILSCEGPGGQASKTVSVNVTSSNTAFDSDADGLLDSWELLYFNDLTRDGYADFDNDGFSDREEYVLKTDPTVVNTHNAGSNNVALVISSALNIGQNDIPITYGQIFKAGKVPAGSEITATLSNGSEIPVQIDKKASHADGSLRHAVVTVKLPELIAGGNQAVSLEAGGSAGNGAAVSLTDLLASSFEAVAEINLDGNLYTASARELLQSNNIKQWLNGPLVSEWIIGAPVKDASNNPHPHLTAYFHVRAYARMQTVRVDMAIENNWTFVSSPGKATYDVNLKVGDATVYSKVGLAQFHHTRWHKTFWWGVEPKINISHDTEYLQASKAVPNYEDGLSSSETTLNSMISSVEPMEQGNLRSRFGDTGASDQIGPLPRWDALYLVSGDSRALAATLANASAGGSYSMHYRDENTGLPVSIDTYPRLSENGSPTGFPSSSGGNPLQHDLAHQPSIGYLAYLATGDYYYLEELLFWANYNMLWTNPDYRKESQGIFGSQNRTQIWSMRTLAYAAYITPDTHPQKQYYLDRLDYNIEFRETNYLPRNNLGAIQDYDYPQYSPWQNDWYVWVFGSMVELGFDNATIMRDWLSQWSKGRMGISADDFCYQLAPTYRYYAAAGPDKETFYPNFRTLYEANFADASAYECGSEAMRVHLSHNVVNTMTGYPEYELGYYSNMQPGLAIAVDAGVASKETHWTRFANSSVTPDYSNNPIWAIVPRETLTVENETLPIVTLQVDKTEVLAGENVPLSWNAIYANSCEASGGWIGSRTVNGAEVRGAISADTSFILSCTGGGVTRSQSVTVDLLMEPAEPVEPVEPMTMIFSSNLSNVNEGGVVALSWDVKNAESCEASGAWSGSREMVGSLTVGPLFNDSEFRLLCSSLTEDENQEIVINIKVIKDTTGENNSSGGGAIDYPLLWTIVTLLLFRRNRRYSGSDHHNRLIIGV